MRLTMRDHRLGSRRSVLKRAPCAMQYRECTQHCCPPIPLPRWHSGLNGRETAIVCSESDKTKFIQNIHKTSRCTRYQESGFKLLTRWYRTPCILKKIFRDQSDRCWRCGVAEGSLLHIFWDCMLICRFWKKVRTHLTKFLSIYW